MKHNGLRSAFMYLLLNTERGLSLLALSLALFLFSVPCYAEYAAAYVGTTGLVKADFTIVVTNDDTCIAQSTSAITVMECPAASSIYKFDSLPATLGTNYHLLVSYGGVVVLETTYPWGGAPVSLTWSQTYSIQVSGNTWKQNDTYPSISVTVLGFTVDPTGWTARFNMWNASDDIVKIDDALASYTQTVTGTTWTLTFQYDWAATDLNMNDCIPDDRSCAYLAEFKFTNAAGIRIITFPQNDSMRVTVFRKR